MDSDLKVLLVEDNWEHLRLTTYILKQTNFQGDVHIVRDGQEAVDYLYQRNKFADASSHPRPHLVLLDLNIPRIDGKEVLRIIKTDKNLQDIPVVVVSSSERDEDREFAYAHGAAAYISKSGGFEKLNEALAKVHIYASKEKRNE
jgi:two-component system, response regulator